MSIKKRLYDGKKGIFYTTELFLNDHVERDKEIRYLIDSLEKIGIELFIMEIAANDNWSDIHDYDKYQIPTSELINILDENRNKFF